ncbi:MAG: hypothetical protein WBF42_05525, partial [Terracidiphilus sp.]
MTLDDHEPEASPDRDIPGRPSRGKRVIKWVGWIIGACLLLAVAGVAGLVLMMKSPTVHNLVIARLERRLSRQLGTGFHLENFALHPRSLSIELYGITIDGAAPYSNRPLLQLERAEAGVRIPSIFGRKWYLSNVGIDHPVVQIYIDKDGTSNLPRFENSG